jgi:predicted alpha/beta hydrolase family esterase
MTTPVLILPGLGGSGPEHWQSRWEALEPEYRRVTMPDWDRPELDTWVSMLAAAVDAAKAPPVIVAHSLGCLAVAHWAKRGGVAQAALLVAVPDPDKPGFPEVARSFAPVPLEPLRFRSRVVASRDDDYASFVFAERCARAWQSSLSDLGHAGHINALSGLGDWSYGRELLAQLLG